jgi:hypothetical protein
VCVFAAFQSACIPVMVCSDGKSHKLTVGLFEFPATFYYVVTAELASAAFLMAAFTNSSAYTLLSGALKVFVGKSHQLYRL